MKTNRLLIKLLCLIFVGIVFPSYRTGGPFQTFQPNQIYIQIYAVGLEYYPWYEDINGYTVLQMNTGWYTYADLGIDGSLVATEYHVGEVDLSTTGLQPGIEPSQSFLTERLEEYRTQFDPVPIFGNIRFKLIFLEFDTFSHQRDFPKDKVEDMFFSNGFIYHTENGPDHPTSINDEPVFGSFSDYWDEVSYGNISIGVPDDPVPNIFNLEDESGLISWIHIDEPYNSDLEFLQEHAYNWIVSQHSEQALEDLKLAIIIPGDTFAQGNQELATYRYTENYMPNPESVFHIGGHCHEFGHVLGLPHTGTVNGGFYWNKFCLMSGGLWNGPLSHGASPAHIYAIGKSLLGWCPIDIINGNMARTILPIEDGTQEIPTIYLSDFVYNNFNFSDYYTIENRQYVGFDYYLPGGGR